MLNCNKLNNGTTLNDFLCAFRLTSCNDFQLRIDFITPNRNVMYHHYFETNKHLFELLILQLVRNYVSNWRSYAAISFSLSKNVQLTSEILVYVEVCATVHKLFFAEFEEILNTEARAGFTLIMLTSFNT